MKNCTVHVCNSCIVSGKHKVYILKSFKARVSQLDNIKSNNISPR